MNTWNGINKGNGDYLPLDIAPSSSFKILQMKLTVMYILNPHLDYDA